MGNHTMAPYSYKLFQPITHAIISCGGDSTAPTCSYHSSSQNWLPPTLKLEPEDFFSASSRISIVKNLFPVSFL